MATTKETKVDLTHVEAHTGFDKEWKEQKWDVRSLSNAANDISLQEQQMGPREAIQKNPMAIMWCLIISTCVIMEGYGAFQTILLRRRELTEDQTRI